MEGTVLSIKKTTDLAGKSGVYKIGFSGTDNFYIGSSNDIAKRFTYHRSRLKRGVHENPCLTNAFNKYGIDNCFIEIMKVCDASDILIHEQYFLDTLKPEYNIAKSATSGITSKLSNEDILQIRFDYYNRSCREEIQEIADKYKISIDYLRCVASGKSMRHIKNPPDLQDHINKNKGKNSPFKAEITSVPNYIKSKQRVLTKEQVGMIRWAMANNKSVTALYKHLGIKESASIAKRLRKNITYKEYQELVDASHLNLPDAQLQKLTNEDVPKIRWAHQQGISHTEISKVFGCHYNTSCDIKMNRVYKNITNIEPCEHLFRQVA